MTPEEMRAELEAIREAQRKADEAAAAVNESGANLEGLLDSGTLYPPSASPDKPRER